MLFLAFNVGSVGRVWPASFAAEFFEHDSLCPKAGVFLLIPLLCRFEFQIGLSLGDDKVTRRFAVFEAVRAHAD